MKYPIGIQNFEKIRREGYAYVDKTALMYKMVSEGSYYFLRRPRRFGKSLMVSTLEAFFSGKKELFSGLYVESTDWKWQQIDKSAADALQQIEDKDYARPFEGDSRQLFKIGINFSIEKKLIDWVIG